VVRDKVGETPDELGVSKCVICVSFSLQCFGIAGWATGKATNPVDAGCWFVVGDDLTGALHTLQLQLSLPPPSSLALKNQEWVNTS